MRALSKSAYDPGIGERNLVKKRWNEETEKTTVTSRSCGGRKFLKMSVLCSMMFLFLSTSVSTLLNRKISEVN